MKKGIITFILIILTYIIIGNVIAENDIIPDEAIRIRVIANSNSKYDQEIKTKVKESVEYDMYNMLKNTTDLKEARNIIRNNLNNVENNIYNLLQNEKYLLSFDVNFGLNYFPEKKFKGIIYNEGYYESVVVTLGEGLGDNWWCVLFPPLCMIEAEQSTDVKYTTVVKEVIDKYF
jgi:stage II sporulation protein R